MKLTEKTVSGTEIYAGRILHVQVDRVQLPDGHESTREVIRHPGGVGVLALTDAGEVLLVQQYRYPYQEVVTEIPAGKREPGEVPLETGKRELEEETGYVADYYEPLGTVYPSPGYTNEVIYLFLATGLHKTAAHPDEGEFLHVLRRPLAQLADEVLAGALPDAKTQVAILKTWKKMGGEL